MTPTRTTMIALAVCLLAPGLHAESPPYPMERMVEAGQDAMRRLRFDDSRAIFDQIIQTFPQSPVGYGMMSIQTLDELVLAASNPVLQPYGAPDPYSNLKVYGPVADETQRFHKATDRLIEMTDAILVRDPDNAEALYFRGLAEENLATEALVISSDKMKAIGPGRRAKSFDERVLELDPDFVDAKISLAAYNYALATVDGLDAVVVKPIQFFGFFRGDKKKAFRMLDEVARCGRYRPVDAEIMLSIINRENGDPHRSVEIMRSLGERYPETYLVDLNLAGLLAHKLRDPEGALEVYQRLLEALPGKTPGLGEAEVRFLMGKTYLEMDDYSRARAAFERSLRTDATREETRPLGYFYLGQVAEAQGRDAAAVNFYRQFVSLASDMESLEAQVETARGKMR